MIGGISRHAGSWFFGNWESKGLVDDGLTKTQRFVNWTQ